MIATGIVPDWLFTAVAAATVFTVMFDLGLAIVPGEFRWVAQHRALMAKALFAALVAVPALAWAVARALDLPRHAEVGIMLMSISPGAPVALRRSLGAGGHQSFAPALQIALALLAVVSMPLWIAAFDEYYAGTATIARHAGAPDRHLARQVRSRVRVPRNCVCRSASRDAGPARALPSRAACGTDGCARRHRDDPRAARSPLALVDIWKTGSIDARFVRVSAG